MYVNKDDRQKIACIAWRFKQSERAEKVAKLRKLAPKPRGACRSFSRLCSFVTTIRLLNRRATQATKRKRRFKNTNFLLSLSSLHTLNKGIFHDITIQEDNSRKTPRGINKSNDRERDSRAESKNCEILLFPTADNRFDRKVKCPTERASFWVKFPTI